MSTTSATGEWLGLLLDREASWRCDKRLAARLRIAKLRQQASIEDVDYRSPRGLDRALFQKLAKGEWIEAHDNLALVGPTGVGKIFEMKKPMVKRVPTKGIHVTTIRLNDATLAALDKHAKGAAEGARPRSWLIQKIIADWLAAQGDKVDLLGHTQGISE